MSAGMAEVIAAHQARYLWPGEGDEPMECECGHWRGDVAEIHAAHVAEELGKAGHGLLPNVTPEYGAQMMTHGGRSGHPIGHGPERNPNWWNKSTHFRLVGPWQELVPLAGPLAAALADPEGHALVKAIHDRKAEG